MPTLLLVEDDARTAELVATFLTREGFDVEGVRDGGQAVDRALASRPDLVVLDWMLPGEDGLTICRRLRAEGYAGPVLMLTARTDEIDQIIGLEVGADDYLPKPVRPRLLLARIRALLRRTGGAEAHDDRLELGWLVVDRGRREVTVAGLPVDFTTAEFDLLWLLASRAGEPVTRDQLFEELRGIAYDGLDRSMDMRVSQLRKRLVDADPEGRDPIRTVRGVGYQLVRP
jgi:two-component system response regulator RstA